MWGPYWKHKKIQVLCDNMAVVLVLNSLSTKDTSMLHFMRCLHFFCAHFDVKLRATHIPGVLNDIADVISRNHMQIFRRLRPSALLNPTPIPSPLWQMLVPQTPDWLSPTWRALLKTSLEGVLLQAHTERTAQPKGNVYRLLSVDQSAPSVRFESGTDLVHSQSSTTLYTLHS